MSESRRCYYCERPGASVAWPSPGRHSLVWACSDRNACTRRARQIAARRVSEPPEAEHREPWRIGPFYDALFSEPGAA